jgi:hypothetical protein
VGNAKDRFGASLVTVAFSPRAEIIDLCSGSGGAMPRIIAELQARGYEMRAKFTDGLVDRQRCGDGDGEKAMTWRRATRFIYCPSMKIMDYASDSHWPLLMLSARYPLSSSPVNLKSISMAIDPCPVCQSLWDEHQQCVSQIHRLREAAEIAIHSYDHEKAETLQRELVSLEQRSVDVRRALTEHQRGLHPRPGR